MNKKHPEKAKEETEEIKEKDSEIIDGAAEERCETSLQNSASGKKTGKKTERRSVRIAIIVSALLLITAAVVSAVVMLTGTAESEKAPAETGTEATEKAATGEESQAAATAKAGETGKEEPTANETHEPAEPTETEEETPTGTSREQLLYWSGMLGKNSLDEVPFDEEWHNTLSSFGVVKICAKTETFVERGIKYFKVECEPVWAHGVASVTTPVGSVPETAANYYGESNVYFSSIEVEEKLREKGCVMIPETIIDELNEGDTVLIVLSVLGNQLYCRDNSAETIAGYMKNVSEGKDAETYLRMAERERQENENKFLYIPVVDGVLRFEEENSDRFQVNFFKPLNTLILKAQTYKARYLETGDTGGAFCPIKYLDDVPERTVRDGVSVDEFKAIMKWYDECKNERDSYAEAYYIKELRDSGYAADENKEFFYFEWAESPLALSRITSKTGETIRFNGLNYYKVICEVLADEGGLKLVTDRETLVLSTHYDSAFAAAGCFYIDEGSIDAYDAGDSVLFIPGVIYEGGEARWLLINNGRYLFRNGKLQHESSYSSLNMRNLILLTAAASRDEGFDFSDCFIGDLIDSLPDVIFEEGISEKDAADAMNWLIDFRSRYAVRAREDYLAAGGWIFID